MKFLVDRCAGAILRAQRAPPKAEARHELAVLRDADRGDDWAEYAS